MGAISRVKVFYYNIANISIRRTRLYKMLFYVALL